MVDECNNEGWSRVIVEWHIFIRKKKLTDAPCKPGSLPDPFSHLPGNVYLQTTNNPSGTRPILRSARSTFRSYGSPSKELFCHDRHSPPSQRCSPVPRRPTWEPQPSCSQEDGDQVDKPRWSYKASRCLNAFLRELGTDTRSEGEACVHPCRLGHRYGPSETFEIPQYRLTPLLKL